LSVFERGLLSPFSPLSPLFPKELYQSNSFIYISTQAFTIGTNTITSDIIMSFYIYHRKF
jgi:hypothetical protein